MIPKYIADPQTRKQIREKAKFVREYLKIDDQVYINIVKVIENLQNEETLFCDILNVTDFDKVAKFYYPNIAREELLNMPAFTDMKMNNIYIRENSYNKACNGDPVERMNLAHELGHIIMKITGVKYEKLTSFVTPEAYRDPEWQAKCFGGEFMMNKELVENLSADEIAKVCGITGRSANYQKLKWTEEQNKTH